ncbi:DNA topoisomerase 2 [Heracleum sosnowskyi]|uniref:DNA topoisomerase 2 n=1 Tax=Heracleum sosnowskyi TaxID=360622 RepID=A0AAD8HNK2_9APIA|nr:DNA topoisomerase 2 [Heracleum sosnowskyi]
MPNRPLETNNNANTKKTIEETYQKKTQLEHILLRPDTYIGSIEKHTTSLWVYEDSEMKLRSISYVPGLYKIFDEILVNAADNKQRDPKMDCLRVDIDVDSNLISVFNNGDGVPVEIHKEEGVYVPELIFGHLLTSSNYDDDQKKTTGGRNGYGAKLANIFSTEFVIETADGKRLKKYKQVFSNNMGKKSEPNITKCKASDNWTKVSFKPDLEKFNMAHLEDDVVALMKKRVVDIAGCLGKSVKVELNGQRVPVKSFTDYINLYLKSVDENRESPLPRFVEKVNDRWEICVCMSEGQFQQVSFVNSIATIKGGTHVDYVTNQITNHIISAVNKKNKHVNIKAHAVKNHLWVFVNALIDNPAFDSQTKETLTIRQSSFGSKCDLSGEFLRKVETKSGVVDALLSWANFKLSKDLKKTDGSKKSRITGIPKLEDANDAGGSQSHKCTLILTEGDSAKSLAMAGLSVVGRNYYGVFPLRGKLLNVREASHKQIMENAEIQSIKKILGLQHGKEYENVKSLRYGHLMIMTDQDHDGSHIKGLLINFIHSFWPSLLKVPSFMVEFITPIVKATKDETVLSFYTIPEYESWKESLGNTLRGWTIKYYKGLGTSDRKEAKEYFQKIVKHKKDFLWVGDEDGDAIELAFSKKKIEARKNWLRQFEPGTFLDPKESLIKYRDFINKELILFSMADLQRSIPSMVDGLKPGQRKILFCSFKRNLIREAKVAQFSGYVSEHSAYHHGEQSLAGTIVGMAQDFVGSNNIKLFLPKGQFGTRSTGGKDHASARYIYTQLSPITRCLFPKDDDILLDYLNEDGQKIEPTWYVPVIPMVLVNGSEGIGTGWSTYVPNYNPRDIIANIRRLLNGEPLQPIDPWYKGFKGTIEKTATKEAGATYTVSGLIEEIDDNTLEITELPIRRWTQDYKEFLESIMTGNYKIKDPFIEDYRDNGDDVTVKLLVTMSEENLLKAKQEGLLKKFKLTTTISTSNMHLFDSKGVIKKYDNPEQIIEDFFQVRLELYKKRQAILLENLELDLLKLENKVRFILGVVEGKIRVSNRKKADLFLELKEKGFTPFPKKTKVEEVIAGATDAVETEENSEGSTSVEAPQAGDYDYLLKMEIGTLTLERVKKLLKDRDQLNVDVDEMRKATPMSLWNKDLDALDAELDAQDKSDATEEVARQIMQEKRMNGPDHKPSRQAPKNPRKKNVPSTATVAKSVDTSAASAMETVNEVLNPRGKAKGKKAPIEKQGKSTSSLLDDDEIPNLKDRLAAFNLQSSPDQSEVMEVELPQKEAKKKPPRRNKGSAANEDEMSIDNEEQVADISDDEHFEVEVVGKKKGGRKPAAGKAKAPKPLAAPVATKKRGTAASGKQSQMAGQKLITDVLKPVENDGISPEKKVRKMRASPFNKKSGSLLGRAALKVTKDDSVSPISEEGFGGSTSNLDTSGGGGSSETMTRVTRPQRVNRTRTTYVLSDSESEKEATDDDSDFNEDED